MLLILAASTPTCFGANIEEASSAIEDAEAMVINSYKAVAEAQKAGANISNLLNILNEAGWLLSKAKIEYNAGNYDSAFNYAKDCQSTLNGFVDQAESLRLEAEDAGYRDYMINFVGSAAGSVCVFVCGLNLWIVLKRRRKTEGKAN